MKPAGGVGLAAHKLSRLGSIRIRLALLYSILLFGLAAIVVGGIYLSLSRALSDEPVSRDVRYGDMIIDAGASYVESEGDDQSAAGRLTAFEEEVNHRALDRLRTYSVTALAALLLGSFVVGWYVAGLVLRPIGRISLVAVVGVAVAVPREIGRASCRERV